MLHTKSVSSSSDAADGLRVLATRFRGRGLPRTRYDVWMANLGPSEQLLRLFRAHEVGWPEFARRYRVEMTRSPAFDRQNLAIKNHGQKFTLRLLQQLAARGPVTLLCHCAEAEKHCHRHLLQRLIAAA